ncbi:unnamed protein product [Prorocentrum cordatum]|uniref:Apple domain-containing protein n=1 Tax=Prorocentrum cordatum TaxID=2364126 RepID=A0ABN9T9R4_9DINO|nr:unnamed protein product [Polarella glacialis]
MSSFDDSDFSSFDMCCVCGGGTEASPEDEQNAEAGKDAPFFDDHGDTGVYIRARSLLCSAELIGDRFVDNREDCEAFCTQNKHCAGYSWEDSSLHCLLTRDPGVIQREHHICKWPRCTAELVPSPVAAARRRTDWCRHGGFKGVGLCSRCDVNQPMSH